METEPILVAERRIGVSLEQARAWFLSLADHPERYKFGSHAGFTFTEGQFGEPGAHFQTEERFIGVPISLKFELTGVEDTQFTFRVRQPFSDIWGYFKLIPQEADGTRLQLAVGSDQKARRFFLKLPLVHIAIQRQIEREVGHIKTSMESLYKEETWAS